MLVIINHLLTEYNFCFLFGGEFDAKPAIELLFRFSQNVAVTGDDIELFLSKSVLSLSESTSS